MKKWGKKQITTIALIISIISFTLGVTLLSQYANQRQLSTASRAADTDTSLEPYCQNGYYEIPGEQRCSRAPNCGGYGYDELNKSNLMPDSNTCVGNGAPSGEKGCDGYVPVCCYEVARTGDFTKCIGYWERLWCAQSQCDTARSRGASDSQCGGDCQCAHAFNSYCGANKQPVPLAQRLHLETQPTATNTPTSIPPTQIPGKPTYTPTLTPTITLTIAPGQLTPTAHATDAPVFPTTPPTQPPIAQNTPIEDDPTSPIDESTIRPDVTNTPEPARDWQTPKELAREVMTYERVDRLNKNTEKPLEAVKTGFNTVKSYDQQLENIAESWVFRIKIQILKFIQQLK